MHITFRTITRLACLTAIAVPAAQAQTVSDFDNDLPNTNPGTGGLNEPTSLTFAPSGRVEVMPAALGLLEQPVELSDLNGDYVSVDWEFPPVAAGTVRFEADVSFSDLMAGYFMQASTVGGVVARLRMTPAGLITGDAVEVGGYVPGFPFRVRIDVQPASSTYDVTIDRELDGFTDNPTITGLNFVNPGLMSVDTVHASFLQSVGAVPGASVAYDNVYLGPPCIGNNYCTAAPNSIGLPGRICAIGSGFANQNFLTLEAHDLPQNKFGYFITSQTQNFLMGAGGSQGNLCIGGMIGRFNALVQNSGTSGSFDIQVDLTSIPLLGAVLPGQSWFFQCWYRDNNPMPTSNFTDAVAINFL